MKSDDYQLITWDGEQKKQMKFDKEKLMIITSFSFFVISKF
jgi:hypothetical protein